MRDGIVITGMGVVTPVGIGVDTYWEILTAGVGALGGLMSWLYGGFGDAMLVLIVFMALDYMTGLIVAGVFHKSSKSETGALESKAGWKGDLA